MGGGFKADQGVIEGLTKTLRSGSDALNDLAGSVPSMPDAGALSGQMAALISKQVDAAGEYAIGVGAAAQAVEEGGRVYQGADDAAKRSLPQVK